MVVYRRWRRWWQLWWRERSQNGEERQKEAVGRSAGAGWCRWRGSRWRHGRATPSGVQNNRRLVPLPPAGFPWKRVVDGPFRSGLVHFFTRRTESLANSRSGSMISVLTSDMLRERKGVHWLR